MKKLLFIFTLIVGNLIFTNNETNNVNEKLSSQKFEYISSKIKNEIYEIEEDEWDWDNAPFSKEDVTFEEFKEIYYEYLLRRFILVDIVRSFEDSNFSIEDEFEDILAEETDMLANGDEFPVVTYMKAFIEEWDQKGLSLNPTYSDLCNKGLVD